MNRRLVLDLEIGMCGDPSCAVTDHVTTVKVVGEPFVLDEFEATMLAIRILRKMPDDESRNAALRMVTMALLGMVPQTLLSAPIDGLNITKTAIRDLRRAPPPGGTA